MFTPFRKPYNVRKMEGSEKNTANNDTEPEKEKNGDEAHAEPKSHSKGRRRFLKVTAAIFMLIALALSITLVYTQSSIPVEGIVNLEKAAQENTLTEVKIFPNKNYAEYKVAGNENTYRAYYGNEYELLDAVSCCDAVITRSAFSWWYVALPVIAIAVIISSCTSHSLMKAATARMNSKKEMWEPEKQKLSHKVKYEDIAGLEEIKERLKLIADLFTKKEGVPQGIRLPKGILLDGGPGNGKTMLAKAFANECGMEFIAVNSPDLLDPFMGGSELMVRKLFDEARAKSPCVLFFDEFDAIGGKRSQQTDTGAAKGYNSLVNSLLTQLDGMTSGKNIIVMAATNNAEGLDTALVRPGRFDLKLTVPNPDKVAREELIRLYMKDSALDDDVDNALLVSITEGFSCAEIENICNEAKIAAFSRESDTVSADDFHSAVITASTNGLRKKQKAPREERYTTAIHEAGHAVAAYFHSRKKIVRISIAATTSGVGGYTETAYPEECPVRTLDDIRNELIILYGGKAAESQFRGGAAGCSLGAANDIRVATRLAGDYLCAADGIDYSAVGDGNSAFTRRITSLLDEVQKEAAQCVASHWDAVIAIADELTENETVMGDFGKTNKEAERKDAA